MALLGLSFLIKTSPREAIRRRLQVDLQDSGLGVGSHLKCLRCMPDGGASARIFFALKIDPRRVYF